jgi:protein-S-isoprenylcysteine O-methyltransferase Ste14
VSEPQDPAVDHSATDTAPSAASQLFDLRSIIALLFGVYGIILLVMGLFFESEAELRKAGGIDINLWSGIVMIVVAALFALWAWLRPLVPPGEPR